jgi:hypothetical protein
MSDIKDLLRRACMRAAPHSPGFTPKEADEIVRDILEELHRIANEMPATTEHGMPSLDFMKEVRAAVM